MQTSRMRIGFPLALALGWVLVSVTSARAHALGAECKLHGDKVELEAYYDDDTPAAEARVHVLDAKKQTVASGRTDAKGHWVLPSLEPGNYEVVVDAGAGHRTRLRITIPPKAEPAKPTVSDSPCDDCDCSAEPSAISAGPTREEFTSFPWRNVGIGLVVLAVGAVLLRGLIGKKTTADLSQE